MRRGASLAGLLAIVLAIAGCGDRDETVPFWREVVRRVHEHDCRYLVQLAFSGRQRDLGGARPRRRQHLLPQPRASRRIAVSRCA